MRALTLDREEENSMSNEKIVDIESKKLFSMYKQTKNIDIRNELISRYMYIAEILSKKYINKGIDYEDIFQVASLGLIFAIERYDVDRGFEFSSFATPTIIGEIKKHFRDKGWAVRVPRRIKELSKKINLAKENLEQDLQRTPKISEISKYLSVTEEQVIEALEASQVYTPKSLDMSYDNNGEDKNMQLIDIIGEHDKYFDQFENLDFIKKCMRNLNEIEVKIIDDRFFKMKTQIQAAKELGVSQMTVSRMEKKIIKKFQKEYKKMSEI